MSDRPFLPDKADARKFCIAVAIGTWAMALTELLYPSQTAPTGRWSWITGAIFNSAGSKGLAVLWVAVGTFLFITGIKKD
jgi:hypothetical protein